MWQYNYTDSNNDFLAHSGVKGMRWGYSDGKSNGGRKANSSTSSEEENIKKAFYNLGKGYDDLPDDWKYQFNKTAESKVWQDDNGKWHNNYGEMSDDKKHVVETVARFDFSNLEDNNRRNGVTQQVYREGAAPRYKADKKKQTEKRNKQNRKQRLNSGSYQTITRIKK